MQDNLQTLPQSTFSVWHWLIVLFVFMGIYCLPFFVACFRDSTKKVVVFVVNLCFGWTLIGWIIAFVMAVSYEKKSDYQLRIAAMERIVRQ